MIGIGLTFSVGAGVVASMVFGLRWLLTGSESGLGMIRMVIASSIWAFPIGVAFSGVLAIARHGRSFDKLSLPRFAALGAGVGLLFFGFLAINAWHAWSVSTAIANATIFVLLGGGSATGTLMLARRAGPALKSGDESRSLGEGDGRGRAMRRVPLKPRQWKRESSRWLPDALGSGRRHAEGVSGALRRPARSEGAPKIRRLPTPGGRAPVAGD
jgi:hypothetical protein